MCQHLAGSAKALTVGVSLRCWDEMLQGTHGLDLITDQEHVVLLAKSLNLSKVTLRRHDDSKGKRELVAVHMKGPSRPHPASP